MDIIVRLLVLLFFVFLNGFFVASEFALVSVRKTRIKELAKKRRRAKLVLHAIDNLDQYIAATQLGITIASLALGWVGEPALAEMLEPLFSFLPTQQAVFTAHGISVAIAFILITYLHIVAGEIAPKSMALQSAEKVSLFVALPLILFNRVFHPFIWILNRSGAVILKVFGFTSASEQSVHSEEEIKMLLSQSGKTGEIEKQEVEMVYNVFQLGDLSVRQIMVPRIDVIAFNTKSTLEDVIKRIENDRHSRFPVYEQSIDNIIGFVHVKDIYTTALKTAKQKKLSEIHIIRKIIAVPQSRKADDVLLEMQKERVHVAVVNDEYGGTAGIVTLEDVLESLVGEIQDEFEKPREAIKKQRNGSYLIDGLVPLDSMHDRFGLPLGGEYATIGGLIIGKFGRTPKEGDEIIFGDVKLVVTEMEKKRIKTVALTILASQRQK